MRITDEIQVAVWNEILLKVSNKTDEVYLGTLTKICDNVDSFVCNEVEIDVYQRIDEQLERKFDQGYGNN